MIVPRIGLGKKSHLPCFKILDFSFGPIGILKVIWSTASLSLQDMGDEAMVRTGRYTLRLNRRKAAMMFGEWDLWNKFYLPREGVAGMTVLEVGAGCGETTALLFQKGAKKVVCVEPAQDEVRYLSENIRTNGWNAEVVPTRFDLSLLNDGFDFVRMDCEGCESALLALQRLPRVTMEVHSREVEREFAERGMRVTKRLSDNTCIMSNA